MFGINWVEIFSAKKQSSSGGAVLDDEHEYSSGQGQGDKNKGNSAESSKKGSVAVPIVVTMAIVGFIIIVGFFVYRNKHRFFRRFTHQTLDNESRSEMI